MTIKKNESCRFPETGGHEFFLATGAKEFARYFLSASSHSSQFTSKMTSNLIASTLIASLHFLWSIDFQAGTFIANIAGWQRRSGCHEAIETHQNVSKVIFVLLVTSFAQADVGRWTVLNAYIKKVVKSRGADIYVTTKWNKIKQLAFKLYNIYIQFFSMNVRFGCFFQQHYTDIFRGLTWWSCWRGTCMANPELPRTNGMCFITQPSWWLFGCLNFSIWAVFKGPRLVVLFRGWKTTQLYGDYFINHEVRIPFTLLICFFFGNKIRW